MSHVVQTVYICMRCEKKHTKDEYKALKLTILTKGHAGWPTCSCGCYEIRITDDSEDDE